MAAGLHISDGLTLPLDFVTKTAAILAQRRKGKTYAASVLAEELIANELPFVALDPTGAWWGLLAAANGIDPGLPVVVIGGQHGQLPLDPAGGRFLADLVLDHPGYYVIDLSLLGTKAAERQFAYAFADRLYRKKMQPGMDFPLHLFVDEADMFVPQERDAGDNLMLGAFQSIVRRGGLHGLGTTLISQRPALVNKNVLTQLDVLILLRLVAGNDQDYLDKNYVKRSGSPEQRAELMGSLASLALGEAWVWEPGAEPPLFERTQVRERHTFNSSATPKAGEKRVEPKRLADVDIAAIKEAMADAIEKAKQDDPKELRAELARVRQELANARSEVPEPERIEVRTFTKDDDETLRAVAENLTLVHGMLATINDTMTGVTTQTASIFQSAADSLRRQVADVRIPTPREVRRVVERSGPPVAEMVDAAGLSTGARGLLTTMARRHPMKLTRSQLATFAHRSQKSSSFRPHIQELIDGGYATQVDGLLGLTDSGAAAAGADTLEPQSVEEVRATWRSVLPPSAARMFDALVAAYPREMDRDELADAAGVSRTSSGVGSAIRHLRTNGLLVSDALRVTDEIGGA